MMDELVHAHKNSPAPSHPRHQLQLHTICPKCLPWGDTINQDFSLTVRRYLYLPAQRTWVIFFPHLLPKSTDWPSTFHLERELGFVPCTFLPSKLSERENARPFRLWPTAGLTVPEGIVGVGCGVDLMSRELEVFSMEGN